MWGRISSHHEYSRVAQGAGARSTRPGESTNLPRTPLARRSTLRLIRMGPVSETHPPGEEVTATRAEEAAASRTRPGPKLGPLSVIKEGPHA